VHFFPHVDGSNCVRQERGAVWLGVCRRRVSLLVPDLFRGARNEAIMPSMIRVALPALAACCLTLVLSRAGHAQAISGGEFDRAMRPGAYVPYGGAPYTERYGYEVGPVFYLNQNGRSLWYLDYIDRMDRATRFGYRPPNPPAWAQPCWWRWR
jgi:hypothetical protein